jgi:hypothetical protein
LQLLLLIESCCVLQNSQLNWKLGQNPPKPAFAAPIYWAKSPKTSSCCEAANTLGAAGRSSKPAGD